MSTADTFILKELCAKNLNIHEIFAEFGGVYTLGTIRQKAKLFNRNFRKINGRWYEEI